MEKLMNSRVIALRYNEIALKGGNRGWFEERLVKNIQKTLRHVLGEDAPQKITRHHGRMILETELTPTVSDALKRVFGLWSFSSIRRVKTDKLEITKLLLEEFERYLENNALPKSFRVKTRRSEKALSETSLDLDRWFGSVIQERYPTLCVELRSPELTLGVEIRFQETFLWTETIRGQGGLPVGTNAPVLTLISGGLDSPVAAIQILRRGSPSSFIHFYGTPFVGEEALEKIKELVRIVNHYQPDPKALYVIPFGKIQEKIAKVTNPKMRTLLYRRMMIRISGEVAKRIKACALITGESLGQVASQTVENLATIDSVAQLPILRPLIAYDKDEIIEQAHRWGSFATSIQPTLDCCTLFADRHPTLRSTPPLLEEQEQRFSVDELVAEGLAGLMIITNHPVD